MKIGSYEITNRMALAGGLALVAIITLIYLSWPSPKPPDTQQIINDVKIELEKQYTAQLKDKDTQIKDAKNRLTVSEGRYAGMVQKYVELQKEKVNVKPPVTNAETRDRFIALGFVPLPAK